MIQCREICLRMTSCTVWLATESAGAPPFGRNDPWDLRVMVRDYDLMMKPENRMIRTTIETFLQAMREAQPFQLPPDGRSNEERVLPLSFRLGDL
jgi:hypothetical protein